MPSKDIDLAQIWDANTVKEVLVSSDSAGASSPTPEDLLDWIKTVQIMIKALPSWTPRMLSTGILTPTADVEVPSPATTYLSSLASTATEVAFSGRFSSVVAGSSSESDFMLDVPIYLGPLSEDVGKEQVVAKVGIPTGGPTNAELNLYETQSDKPPHLISLLPPAVRSHVAYAKLVTLLDELEPSTRVEFEVITNGGRVPCFILGKRKDEWLGLASCAVWT